MPMGNSPFSLSSQVMKTAPPYLYTGEFRIGGRLVESQVSPFLTESPVAQPVELCMSSHRFGVMKLYRATVPAARSPASCVYGRMLALQSGVPAADGGFPEMSSKNTIGSCLGA